MRDTMYYWGFGTVTVRDTMYYWDSIAFLGQKADQIFDPKNNSLHCRPVHAREKRKRTMRRCFCYAV